MSINESAQPSPTGKTGQVILHVGMHKTGTPSIQSTLKNYDDGRIRYAQLSDLNHSVPIFSLFTENPVKYHIHVKRGRSEEEVNKINKESADNLLEELALNRETLIISGEDISTLTKTAANALLEFIAPHTEKITVVGYLRDPIGFASSALQQYITGGTSVIAVPKPEYRNRFEAFTSSPLVDSVQLVRFDPANFINSSVVADFCDRFSIPIGKVKERRTNESMSLECAKLILHFNEQCLPTNGSSTLHRAKLEFISCLKRRIKGPKFKAPLPWVLNSIENEDVQWLEENSDIDFSSSLSSQEAGIEAELGFEQEMRNIAGRTVKELQDIVAEIDPNVARTRKVTTLLDFLFSSYYFEERFGAEVKKAWEITSTKALGKVVKFPAKVLQGVYRTVA